MKTATMLPGMLAAAAVALMSGATHVRAQDGLSLANNDSIYIDAGTFKVSAGKAKGDMASRIKQLGARELGPGAIVFRFSDKLYIVDVNAEPQMVLAYGSPSPFDPGDPRRFAYDRSGGFVPDPSRPFARDSGDPSRFANDPSRPYAYDPGDPRRYAIDPSRPYAYDPGDSRRFIYDQYSDPPRYAVDPSRPHAYDPGDSRRFAYDRSGGFVPDPSRPFARDSGDPARFAHDPSRPYAYDPGDPRRYAYDPDDPHAPLIYNPNRERQVLYVRDPDYAQYRLKRIFDENWSASGVK